MARSTQPWPCTTRSRGDKLCQICRFSKTLEGGSRAKIDRLEPIRLSFPPLLLPRISKLSSTNQEKRGTISSDRYRIDESCLKAGIREFPSKRFLEGWLLNSRSKRNFVTNGFYDIFNVVVEQCETGLGRPGCRPVTPAESRPAHTETALTFTR